MLETRDSTKLNFQLFIQSQTILLIIGLLLTISTKVISYTRFINIIERRGFNYIDFLYIIQRDILIFILFIFILLLQNRLKRFKKTRIILFISTFASISLYYLYSFVNLKWIIESGTNVTFDLVREYANRSSDLVLIATGYGVQWIIGMILIPVGILMVLYTFRHAFSSFKFKTNLPEKITILFILLTFLSIPYIWGKGNYFGQLRLHPILYELKNSAIINVLKESFSDNEFSKVNTGIPLHAAENSPYPLGTLAKKPNIVFIILESTGFIHTPLSDNPNAAHMPFLEKIAQKGIMVPNVRTTFPRTTKALFSILSGQYPVPSSYLAETEINFPIAGIPEYFKDYGYTSAFFQSAVGSFERRPSLIKNLGFDYFMTAQEIDPKAHIVGAHNMDEFILIPSITKWIREQNSPYIMTILTSITHHPYVLPGDPDLSNNPFRIQSDEERKESYKRALTYSDTFIEEVFNIVNVENTNSEETLFIIVGDHGEAFGNHGQYTHSLNLYDDTLKVPLVFYWKNRLEKRVLENHIFSVLDILPTIFKLIQAQQTPSVLTGINMIGTNLIPRNLFFTSWDKKLSLINELGIKYIIDTKNKTIEKFDTLNDSGEKYTLPITKKERFEIEKKLLDWKTDTFRSGFDKKTKSGTKIYNWECQPSGYGACE